MPIFNSLGSNYDFSFVLKTLFAGGNEKQLKNFLATKYSGDVNLVYKGREAIRLALRLINLRGTTVAVCGYTCFAVYDAVVKEGYTVEYLDIEKDKLHFSFEAVKKHLEKNSDIKTLIIQNTLGYPCEIEKIAAFCKEKNIALIEDLAHAIGTVYANGKEAGTVGDFTVLSFSQDKMIDGISGGALVVRNSKFRIQNSELGLSSINKNKQIIDRLYPLFTFLIRKTYAFGVGKVIHALLKTGRLLSNPMTDSKQIYSLPSWYSSLIYLEFKNLDKNLSHRRKIAKIYAEKLNKKLLFSDIEKLVESATNLRFPIVVEKRNNLISYLKTNNIFVSDIWYDSPVAPKKYMHLSNYDHQCPNAEEVSEQMLNLPTHRNVTEKHAEDIVTKINLWQQSQ